jgi:hypothetical protein
LLVTNGLHPAHQAERLKDARERGQRLVVTGYELVRQPRHGSSAAAWTWRIEDEQVQTWRYRLKSLIRSHGDAELQRAWWSLTHAPGFSAIRKQTRGIMTFAKSEWKRSRAKTEQWPFRASIRLSYVRRITHQTRPLTALMRERTHDTPTSPLGRGTHMNRCCSPCSARRPTNELRSTESGTRNRTKRQLVTVFDLARDWGHERMRYVCQRLLGTSTTLVRLLPIFCLV